MSRGVVVLVSLLTACADGSTAPSVADANSPALPRTSYAYTDAANPLPAHFLLEPGLAGTVVAADNRSLSNPITNAGATLGRVLFYDRRLSSNDTKSCASCHRQSRGFSDDATLSVGFAGGVTGRHSMGLTNARYYARGRFFWDERAVSLEDQVLQPIQNAVELGMSLDTLELKLAATTFYPSLFTTAFGSAMVTRDRIARALAQFVRSMVSANSKYDLAFNANGVPNFAAVLTPQESQGEQLFHGPAGCARCHVTNAQILSQPRNIGLDAVVSDTGMGGGRFKAPSLRNVAVRGPFMHDGRFATLSQVVDHYDSGIQDVATLDPILRTPGGQPQRLNLTPQQRDAIVAYLGSLTDTAFLTDRRFSDPFVRP